jgi:hypothetical protein
VRGIEKAKTGTEGDRAGAAGQEKTPRCTKTISGPAPPSSGTSYPKPTRADQLEFEEASASASASTSGRQRGVKRKTREEDHDPDSSDKSDKSASLSLSAAAAQQDDEAEDADDATMEVGGPQVAELRVLIAALLT